MTGPLVRALNRDILPTDVGFTLSHEHVYCDFAEATGDPDLRFTDESAILADLREAQTRGVQMLVELSTYDMGGSPIRVAQMCETTGLLVVKGTGWYRSPSLDAFIGGVEAQALAARAIADISDGFAGTELRAGVLGEIGITGSKPTPAESVALDATASAAIATGVGVVAHTDDWLNARSVIDELTRRGVMRPRIMMSHCRRQDPLTGLLELADAGMTLSFDQLGHPKRDPVSAVAERICELVSHGFGSQLVVSADVGRSSRLRGVGGSGYVEGVHRLLAALKAMGLSQDLLDGMTTTGPARFLAFTGSRG